jgi:prefoldin alpha subunit
MTNNIKETKTVKLNKDQTISLYRAKEKELKSISQKLQEINNLFIEISKAENTLKEIQKLKTSEKLLINIGAGILVECQVTNTKEAKISLPGTIMVTKDISQVVLDIENRKKELSDVKEKLAKGYNNNVKMLQEISKALEMMRKQNIKESDKVNVN